MKLAFGFVVFLLMSLPAKAAMTGNELLTICEHADAPDSEVTTNQQWDTMHCVGYISGVTDANTAWWDFKPEVHGGPNYCLVGGVNNGQVFRVVVKYLREHPERLHFPAARLINEALTRAFPCKS
jgi:hypothetical protein